MIFKEMNLSDFIKDGLERQGFEQTTEIQEKCIPAILEGKDVIGASQTGSGKTYAFAIPALEMLTADNNVQTLVVCPTRELAAQVCDEMRKLTARKEGAKIVPIFGGSSMERQIFALKKNARIIVGTPGRLMDHIRRRTLKLEKVNLVVLDEADEMLDMGFKEDIEEILRHTNNTHQTVMFSATMPKPILDITKNFMKEPLLIEGANQGKAQTFIEQNYVCVDKVNKQAALKELLDQFKPMRAIVFCNTKAMVDELSQSLMKDYQTVGLHGDMRQSERRRAIDAIKANQINLLVATDVAARGIDIKDVDMVINYDIPNNCDYYIHRIGRTARAGKTGRAFTIISGKAQMQMIDVLRRETKNLLPEYTLSISVALGSKSSKGNGYAKSRRPDAKSGDKFGKKPYAKAAGDGQGKGYFANKAKAGAKPRQEGQAKTNESKVGGWAKSNAESKPWDSKKGSREGFVDYRSLPKKNKQGGKKGGSFSQNKTSPPKKFI